MVESPSLPLRVSSTISPATEPLWMVALLRPQVELENVSVPLSLNNPCASAVGLCVTSDELILIVVLPLVKFPL